MFRKGGDVGGGIMDNVVERRNYKTGPDESDFTTLKDRIDFIENLGGGKSGKEPLIFQTNGSPYRGFLDGRIKKNQYQLILRLSNMELKKV